MSTDTPSNMERQRVLGAVLIGVISLSIVALFEVLGTIVFALTVAYILAPFRRELRQRGVGRIPATLIVTVGAVGGILAILAPLVFVLFVRADQAVELIQQLPDSITLAAVGFEHQVTIEEIWDFLAGWLTDLAFAITAQVPILAVKFALFAFVVFALVHNERDIASSTFSVVPPRHRDIARALHRRARDTLYAIYILQGATALATVIIAMPVFYLLGYEAWLSLATVAGLFQFVPMIGPSVLIIAIIFSELILGQYLQAALVLVVGGVLIVAAPDVVIRPRLAAYATKLSGVLYFVGFVGGLLTLGAIGVIVGPLVVALLVETANLLAEGFDEESDHPQSSSPGT